MGNICAPSYVNIFISEFEAKYNYPLIKSKSVIYLRYIDGIVMVWIKSEIELRQFMSEINKKQSIKFDFKFSKKNVEFLNTLVYIGSINRRLTTLAKKPTECQNYLLAKSTHPFSLKKSIPYSQALRIKRIFSTIEEYRKPSQDLFKKFVEKGYNKSTVRKQINQRNNQRKDKKTITIEVCRHLNNNERTFSKLGKFTLTEQLRNTKIEIERKTFLRIRQKIWLGIISFY